MLKNYFACKTNKNERNSNVMRGTIVLPLLTAHNVSACL